MKKTFAYSLTRHSDGTVTAFDMTSNHKIYRGAAETCHVALSCWKTGVETGGGVPVSYSDSKNFDWSI